MKASQLIEALAKQINEVGDNEVQTFDSEEGDMRPIAEVYHQDGDEDEQTIIISVE